ncbi:hypothetical protein CcrBL47_gp441 [Caulobacter phage BL47]|nr:hypothetical protein CcrBL47_gp441 [Caulobacter phage BL47]
MSKTPVSWLLQTHAFNALDMGRMLVHAANRGWTVHTLQVIPFIHQPIGTVPRINGPVAIYGLGAAKASRFYGWGPGVWDDYDAFSYKTFLPVIPDLMLNSDALVVKLSEVSDVVHNTDGPFFLKPAGENKEFPAGLTTRDKFEAWMEKLTEIDYLIEDDAKNDIDVVVALPKDIVKEWRVTVVDGAIVSSTLYVPKARRELPEAVEAVVREAISRYEPAPVYVIDVAQTVEGDHLIVEYNSWNSAGFYDGDIEAMMDAITAYIERTV